MFTKLRELIRIKSYSERVMQEINTICKDFELIEGELEYQPQFDDIIAKALLKDKKGLYHVLSYHNRNRPKPYSGYSIVFTGIALEQYDPHLNFRGNMVVDASGKAKPFNHQLVYKENTIIAEQKPQAV